MFSGIMSTIQSFTPLFRVSYLPQTLHALLNKDQGKILRTWAQHKHLLKKQVVFTSRVRLILFAPAREKFFFLF